MRVESGLVDNQKGQKEKEIGELKSERSDSDGVDKGSRKNNRRRDKKPLMAAAAAATMTGMEASAVQMLYNTCRKVFARGGAGFIPSSKDVQRLQLVLVFLSSVVLKMTVVLFSLRIVELYSMKPDDVGMTPEMPYFKAPENGRVPLITYLHLYDCNKFSIGIFCLPPSGVIPLHNHPGMTVFSKILFGSMHIKSYDWETGATHGANSENLDQLNGLYLLIISRSPLASSHLLLFIVDAAQPPGTRLAKINTDTVFTAPCKTSILYPSSGGNMHCFTAVTSCAVLDVLGPPYSDPEGRHCTYYKEFPYCSASSSSSELASEDRREEYAWLEEIPPENLVVVGAQYRGPKIVVK
ncbi:hypothetical protein Syun_023744 [Stephania yunnanensis]|uniref:cysteine dioxygenase n=1 Tax=Stephania yunnanensis TaxID=152371 RepID=A0AAP0FHW1_9MAGN